MSQPTVHRLTRVSSTLDVIHEYAARGAPHGTAVVAEEQEQGRGTRGRLWHSPLGGFWYSILYRGGKEEAVEPLSLRIGITVARTLETLLPGKLVGLKWPNDLMLENRKLGGVLCEARWQGESLGWIAVGLGLNVANPIPPALDESAISLASVAPALRPESLVSPLTAALRRLDGAEPLLTDDEMDAFGRRDWLFGRRLSEPVAGVARGITKEGMLLVESPEGSIKPVRAGHVLLA